MADRWGDVVYTVVGSNPRTHTFEICNPILGQSRVVHRNLLLCVNFLPVLPEADDSSSLISSDPEECDAGRHSTAQPPQSDCTSVVPSCASDASGTGDPSMERLTQPDCDMDHTDRTRLWVSQIPLTEMNDPVHVVVPPTEPQVTDTDCQGVSGHV